MIFITITGIIVLLYLIIDDRLTVKNANCPDNDYVHKTANITLYQSVFILLFGVSLLNCVHKKNICCKCGNKSCNECCGKCCRKCCCCKCCKRCCECNKCCCVCCRDCSCCNKRCFMCCSRNDQWIYLSILIVFAIYMLMHYELTYSTAYFWSTFGYHSYIVLTMIPPVSLLFPFVINFTSLYGTKLFFICLLILIPTFIVSSSSSLFIQFPGFVLLGMPILLMITMKKIEVLKEHWFEIIGIYISLLDLFTDILVAIEYINTNHLIWAIIQIILTVITQILSCIDMYSIGIISSLFSLVGLGRPLIVIQTWFYPELSYKFSSMKTWELFYESLPSFTFQLYVLLAQLHDDGPNRINDAIIPSIMVVMSNTSMIMWMYVVSKTKDIRVKVITRETVPLQPL